MTVEKAISINRVVTMLFGIILTGLTSFTFVRVNAILEELQSLREFKAEFKQRMTSLEYSEHSQDAIILDNKDYCIRNYEANRDRIDKINQH